MPVRQDLSYNSVSRDSENGGRWKGGGGNAQVIWGDTPGTKVVNSLLAVADLVDTVGRAVDGTAPRIDNVLLAGDEIILRAANIGAGGDVDNGLWRVPADPTDPWVRYREDLHSEGLTVLIGGGAANLRTAVGNNDLFGGYADSHWVMITPDPVVVGTDAIEFRQLPTHDGLKLRYTLGGAIPIPGGGTWQVPFDIIGQQGGFTLDLGALYMTPTTGAAANVTVDYSGVYRVGVSVKGTHAAGPGPIGAGVYVGPTAGAVALYQEVICHSVGSTFDERFYGETLVRLSGDDLERLEVHLYDPLGVGFTFNPTDIYMDISLHARR